MTKWKPWRDEWLTREPFDGGVEAWERRCAANRDSWQEEETRWRAGGLDECEIREVRELLVQSCAAREKHEEVRQEAVYGGRRCDGDAGQEVTRRRRAIREVLEILETDRNQGGRPVWRGRACEITKAQLKRMLLDHLPPPLPFNAHRIGEPWVRPFVNRLALIFGRTKSKAGRAATIHAALVLAGHGDVVTRETVRHILRSPNPKIPAKRVRLSKRPRASASVIAVPRVSGGEADPVARRPPPPNARSAATH